MTEQEIREYICVRFPQENESDHLIFQNYGSFLPTSIEDVVEEDCPQSIYRNRFLVEAMRNLNMIETEGGGIRKLFLKQSERYFPLPEYDLSNGKLWRLV